LKRKKSKKYRALQWIRITVQVLFFSLFFFLLLRTHFPGDDYISRVEIFFHFDPLIAITAFIASRTLVFSFGLAAVTIIVTLVLGRVACGWVCPMGSIQQFFSSLFKKTKLLNPKKAGSPNTVWKYYILVLILSGSLLSLNLTGLLDPLSLLYRSFAVSILPALSHVFSNVISLFYQAGLYGAGDSLVQFFETVDVNAVFVQSFFLGVLFFGILLLNASRERFWCRTLCPLGAFLGILARWNILKLKIDQDKCIKCNLCTIHCQTGATPYPEEEWKSAECIYCFTCGAICPTSAIDFHIGFKPERIQAINLSRRKVLLGSFLGILAIPFFRVGPSRTRASEKLIRPPGALPEEKFLQKCVKCGECMKVCPTNGLQPAKTEAGPEGIWTPVLIPKIGYCEYYCSLCSQVCPTGAIRELRVPEKTQVKIGSSWINKNRCIPWKFGDPCIVCEEHCPVSPKAIKMVIVDVLQPDGTIKSPKAPVIDTDQCIGCGICENKCPVVDEPAIYVTSIGESRSEKNQFRLDLIRPMDDFTQGEDIY
jgi:MauM/NapG family ferredoxin protein